MQPLLLLTHRIPYPPDKGDKIRSFHWLQNLARHYRIQLGTFLDDPEDRQYLPEVRRYCERLQVTEVNPRWRRLGSLRGLFGHAPLSLTYYRDPALGHWIDETVAATGARRVLAFSSTTAQYITGPRFEGMRRVVDFVDVDSAKWRAYAESRPGLRGALYARESRTLEWFERGVARRVDASVFVSEAEAALFRQLPGVPGPRVHAIGNGVDTAFFTPAAAGANPYPGAGPALVFTGAMDYLANVDAVTWFARNVLPSVQLRVPDASFFIVGARPAPAVQRLAALPGVHVTGRVPDVRPWLAHAALAVAPLRIARGVQNKVLEAMAMGRPVLATAAALEGLALAPALEAAMSATEAGYADRITHWLTATPAARESLGLSARQHVLQHHRWDASVAQMINLLEAA